MEQNGMEWNGMEERPFHKTSKWARHIVSLPPVSSIHSIQHPASSLQRNRWCAERKKSANDQRLWLYVPLIYPRNIQTQSYRYTLKYLRLMPFVTRKFKNHTYIHTIHTYIPYIHIYHPYNYTIHTYIHKFVYTYVHTNVIELKIYFFSYEIWFMAWLLQHLEIIFIACLSRTNLCFQIKRCAEF